MSISIPATMKFIVRGKSVDFRNREGSSPSIPKKGPFGSLTIYPTLSFWSWFKIRYVSHSSYSFTLTNVSEPNFFLLSQVVWYIWYTYNWTPLSKESPFEWFTLQIIAHTETYKVFFLKIQEMKFPVQDF